MIAVACTSSSPSFVNFVGVVRKVVSGHCERYRRRLAGFMNERGNAYSAASINSMLR
jgi:hypothetical protein